MNLTLGKSLLLTDSNERTTTILNQKPISYLWYLLLTFMEFYTY
jgi:hypothetical protein